MKFTLKDYQTEAVSEALDRLRKARKDWHEDGYKSAFWLTAVTGAGKTVMAAGVFEALFHGDEDFDFDADPTAVVIWFSDDPALNEQTRFRLIEASDRLNLSNLQVVGNNFNRAKFQAQKIYFLNTQKLGKNSLLVRGFEGDPDEGSLFPETRPDLKTYTIWDTIRNTIEDPSLTLYLVLDEAHRGMSNPTAAALNAKATIVQRLINGAAGVPGIPVVWGISATVERFDRAMVGAQGRSTLPGVVVDATKVQESGLLKDAIILDIPKEAGPFDMVIVRRATDKLREVTEAWAEYAKQQDGSQPVIPLMVLQVPNTPDLKDIGRALDTIFQQWPELPTDSVANVFGEHTALQFGSYSVPYVSPERVQDSTWVRVLIAKDAISTGWDCPRAEVMVSFRAAVDRTHITQLLGRMIRTPLARRIPGNDALNSVSCLLPLFDVKTVGAVADALMKGGGDDTGPPSTIRVLINPKTMKPNSAASAATWAKFESLPSQSRPQRAAKPPKRLTALAHELSADGLLPDAGKKAHAEMHKVLDAVQVRYKDLIVEKRNVVMRVEGKTLKADLKNKDKSFDQFWEDADMPVIDDAYRRAARFITADIARTYTEALAQRKAEHGDFDDLEDALVEARVDIAALGLVDEVKPEFDREAEKLAKEWLKRYRVEIKGLSHDRQEAYRQIQEMSSEPQDFELVKPEIRDEPTSVRENDAVTALPTYKHHLFCDEQGEYPAVLNSWEKRVLAVELGRPGFAFWYRNPQQAGQSSLGIAYSDNGQHKIVRPDFIFFFCQKDGTIVADIVDPHGIHLGDALPKLQGLSLYAQSHATVYRRIESIVELDGRLRVLDLTDEKVRKGILVASNVRALFAGPLASDYA
jgi:type III restriction enzyme